MNFDEFVALSEDEKRAYLQGNATAVEWREAYESIGRQLAAQLGHPDATVRAVPTSLIPPDPLVAARERLGAWLSAEPGRAWDFTRAHDGTVTVPLSDRDTPLFDNAGWFCKTVARGTGPDLAAAILDALRQVER